MASSKNGETGETAAEILKQKDPQEVERKFLVKSLPKNLDSYPHDEISQGYLAIDKDGSEVRVRDRAGAYTQTVKSKGTLSRGEREIGITKEQFDTLWPATVGKRVNKIRFSIPGPSDSTIELDIYLDELMGLTSVEVEFADEEQAGNFEVPEWFGAEVTELKSMKNQSLAENGFPTEILS